jgi:hypothetical protein
VFSKSVVLRGLSVIVLLAALLASLAVAPANPVGATSSPTCTSNYCSGSDGASLTNEQGAGPQYYVGEVGSYYLDASGGSPRGGGTYANANCNRDVFNDNCYEVSAANAAITRANAGTGIGIAAYYIGGGPDSTYHTNTEWGFSSMSNYCWGWQQGSWAVRDLGDIASISGDSNILNDTNTIFLDIEAPGATFGWIEGNVNHRTAWQSDQDSNRLVFNGFTDFIAGRGVDKAENNNSLSCDDNDGQTISQPGQKIQYGLYTTANNFNELFSCDNSDNDGQMYHTLEWTAQYQAGGLSNPWPTDFNFTALPGLESAADSCHVVSSFTSAAFFGQSDWHISWQFNGSPGADVKGNPPDWDQEYEPFKLYADGNLQVGN